MIENERICMMALTMTEGLGNAKTRVLLEHFGTASEIFTVRHRLWEMVCGGGGNYLPMQIARQIEEGMRRAEREVRFIEQHRICLYVITDEDYPYRLRECFDPPVVCYYRGNANLNASKVVSVVGTRRATEYGLRHAEELVKGIAAACPGTLVVSGLAYGIDICAHRQALRSGLPTIGVMAHGQDDLYPRIHRETALQMLNRGGLLTDYPSETIIRGENFLKRNRLIAGLADAIVVVESPERSGALSTAAHAFAYNRDVFAFPGRVEDDHTVGCNRLIRELKAKLITSSIDLIDSMMWNNRPIPN